MQRFFDGTLLLVSTIAVVTACGGGGKNDNGGSGGGTSTGSGGSSTNSNGGSSTTAGNPGNGGMTASNGGGSSTSGGATTNSGGASTSSGGTSTTSGGATSDGAGGSSAGAPAKGGGTSTGGTASGGSGGGATTSEAVLERNNSPTRDGHFKQPTLTKAAVGKMAADTDFKASIANKDEPTKSDMWASPLYMSNGPGGKAAYFAVTTKNDVFAIDAATGAELWVKNIGSSPSANQPSTENDKCGSIHPLGIISTPVIDAAKRTLYTVGAIGTTSISTFELHAIGIDDGMEKAGYPIDLSTIPADKLAKVYHHNQRGALTMVNGVIYIPFGGHVGDCGAYHGRVIAVDTNDTTKRGAWQTRGARGEAIWAPGGLSSDGNGVFAITGNLLGNQTSRDQVDSEEVVRLTGLATFTRNNQNLYYASDWQNMDDTDADFGTMNALVFSVPGSTPSKLVAALSKDGRIHLLDAANLGGADGKTPLQNFKVANASNSMAIHTVPATYTTATGSYIAFSTDTGAMCPTGQPSGKVIMGVAVTPGAPPTLKVAWCAALAGAVTSPIATTTNGSADAVVWFMSNGKLTAVDGDTGAVLYTSADSCSNVQRWTSPIAANGHIVVGAKDKLCSWSPH